MINIIGAGPAGLYIAYLLAKAGKEVNVFEEHAKIGLPVQCTGIITSHLKDILEIDSRFLVNRVTNVRVISKRQSAEFKLKYPNYIVDRERFDSHLAALAKKHGARIFLGHKYMGQEKGFCIIRDVKNDKVIRLKCSILIGSDGPLSRVSEMINPGMKRKYWVGCQARANIRCKSGTFEAYFGDSFPGFFGWVVPESASVARIGIASKKNVNILFRQFLKSRKIRPESIIEYQAGLIPVFCKKQKLQNRHKNIFLVGDAASQVKATTGGGIIPSLRAAELLSESILQKRDYEKLCRKELNKDLVLSQLIRKTLDRFSDKDYDRLFALCRTSKVKSIIESFDREYPSRFMLRLAFAEPRLVYFVKYLF